MGDRTFVCLWVMKDDGKKMSSYIEKFYGDVDTFETDQFTEFTVFEVNYGVLEIYPWAKSQGIPYSYRWETGNDYGPGFQHLRFDSEGKTDFIEFCDEDLQVKPEELYELLIKAETLDNAHEAYSILRSFLKQFTKPFIPLEWETQKHNKLVARTVNLISGS